MRGYLRQLEPFLEQRTLDFKRALYRAHAQERYIRNLQLLNDILRETEFGTRYWVIGGLLLGWAREGRLLSWDMWDADFAYVNRDRALFYDAGKHLIQHGFEFKRAWHNNTGICTQFIFFKDYMKIEFWEMTPHNASFEYFMYGTVNGRIQEARCIVPAHETEAFYFLNRTWHKPTDHAQYLTNVFGSWQIPNPDFHYMRDQRDIVAMYPWCGYWENRFNA